MVRSVSYPHFKNRIYIGVLEQGKRVKINYKLDKTVSRPKEEWAVIENNHMKRLSVKQILKNVARLMRLDTRIAPKAGKVIFVFWTTFCGACGRIMVRRTVKRSKGSGIYYICSTYNKGQGAAATA